MTEVHSEDLPLTDTEVLIVGAGPTGLMAAVALARRGVRAVIVDRKTGPTRESRALAVQARTMEIYDQLGLAEHVLAGAYQAERMQIGRTGAVDGVAIGALQDGATRFPGVQIFEQSRNEQLLYNTLLADNRDVRWQHRLIDLVDSTAEPGGRVRALLEGPEGLVAVTARWCIGADGAASAVRRELDLRFDGVTDDATFWVADVRNVRGVPEGSMAMRFGTATFAIAFPLGDDGHTRLVALAPRDTITQQGAIDSARSDLGLTLGAVDWFSTYRVHHRVASRFRAGSVFLAGDAGHVHSPVGGQGMNTGLQDAHNLAMLLADIRDGRLDDRAVARYERERRPVAVHLVKVTDRAFGVIGRRTPATALLRRRFSFVLAKLAPVVLKSALGPRLGGYLGQYRIRYHYLEPQEQTPAWADDPAVGRRLPPVQNNQQSLQDMTWQLHSYGAGEVSRPEVPEWMTGPHTFGADPHGRLRSDRLYLVRPDQFVAASIPMHRGTADATQLSSAMVVQWIIATGEPTG
ncbi:FAD-dependent oxidoreductase [Mycolicibacterium komossense]|uniref:FAD-dependent monooxygenase n=1 Tax=Mycolicibacterium komossense TaxID=1779 RepID=A0ABT3CMQ1_9MYCO|nr:FAD-dependent monooxygenase [Mycolicibacterium komossense]MCV7230803.1 FAD-dependent monooxygenase [Mycolicibacterium komossense]